jgi:hypothetical protein
MFVIKKLDLRSLVVATDRFFPAQRFPPQQFLSSHAAAARVWTYCTITTNVNGQSVIVGDICCDPDLRYNP